MIEMAQRKRHKPRYIIPGLVYDNEKWVPFEKYPDFEVYGEKELGEVLKVSKQTLHTWKRKGLIPYTQAPGYSVYKVLDVIEALKKHGYHQENPYGQPKRKTD